uniref:Immunoglobulin V-set domain-containing protein n=1 Tax=Oryzias melastigma TaxID=30732 RepID=A0A3B3BLS8_ORYME
MVNLTVVLASLCTLSLISFSLSEFHTVKVQLEGEVTLQCSNFSTLIVHIIWFKLNDGPNATVISSMFTADVNATMKNGFKDRFLMTSNITHVFLNIKNVNSSDSGLYFCGNNKNGGPVIVGATCLQVYGKIIQKNINKFLLKAPLNNK